EPPFLLVEHGHRAGDRVDPPAADRNQVADELRDGRGDGREDPTRPRRPGKRGETARQQDEEGATPVRPLVIEILHGAPCIDRVFARTLQPELAVAWPASRDRYPAESCRVPRATS